MKSVLLTNPIVPYDPVWGEDYNDLTGSRLTRGQGPFTLKSHGHCWALYLIAENLTCPVTVLENPTIEEFEVELSKGYDYWGVQVKVAFIDKIAKMIRVAKKTAPQTKIVLGGYGVKALYEPVPHDPENLAGEILENADFICEGDGVRFFRELLNDEPIERPITQFTLPLGAGTIPGLEKMAQFYNAIVVAALGCPGGCDFCATSHFFNKQKVRLLSPDQCFETMAFYAQRLSWKNYHCTVYDEDLLRDADYVRKLGSYIRASKTHGLDKIKYLAFGSIEALEQYDIEELQLHGVDSIWVGVESTIKNGLEKNYPQIAKKHRGRTFEEVFSQLHNNGIVTTGSMILGFDFHTPENILEDIERFVKLKPVFYQIGPLIPCPGTELYRNLKRAGKLRATMTWHDGHLFADDLFDRPNFKPGELKKFFDYIHERLYEENGPSFLGSLDVNLNGYRKFKDAKDEPSRLRAELLKRNCQVYYACLDAVKEFATGKGAKERAREVEEKYKELLGEPSPNQKMLSQFFFNAIKNNVNRKPKTEPIYLPPRWTYYRQNSKPVYTVKGRREPSLAKS